MDDVDWLEKGKVPRVINVSNIVFRGKTVIGKWSFNFNDTNDNDFSCNGNDWLLRPVDQGASYQDTAIPGSFWRIAEME